MTDFYQTHIFVCTNQKKNGKKCCGSERGEEAKNHLKKALIAKGTHGEGQTRVSASGCLGRCGKGPCIVIYPENTWYSYNSLEDLDTIINEHLIKGEAISQLQIEA